MFSSIGSVLVLVLIIEAILEAKKAKVCNKA